MGVTCLYDLLRAPLTAQVNDVMSSDVISVQAQADQEEAARLMSRYSLLSVPVVAADDRLLGIITHDDLVDVIEREATEDIQKLGATQPLDRNYLDTPVLCIVVWANVVGSLLPLLASRLRIDPAIVSGPFMSTLVDATGLLIYLQIAKDPHENKCHRFHACISVTTDTLIS